MSDIWSATAVAFKGTTSGGVTAPVITSATTASGTVGSAFSYQITADQFAHQLRRDGIAGGFHGQYRDGVDLGDADGGGNLDRDAERDQQRWHRHRDADADGHVAPPVITSATTASGTVGSAFSYQITATNSPTSYGATGTAGGINGQYRDGADLGDAHGGGNLHRDAERDQQQRHRQCHPDADDRGRAAGDHQRHHGQWDGGQRLLLSDHGHQLAHQLWRDRIARRTIGQHRDGLISGTPTAAGTSTVTLSATNSAGTGTATLTLTITPRRR